MGHRAFMGRFTLMAMAAGDPIEIRDEYARYTAEQTGGHFQG
jgi:hypothetical protein